MKSLPSRSEGDRRDFQRLLGEFLKAVGLLNLLRLHPEQVRDSEMIYLELADLPRRLSIGRR
jgi:hypothetical protein